MNQLLNYFLSKPCLNSANASSLD